MTVVCCECGRELASVGDEGSSYLICENEECGMFELAVYDEEPDFSDSD